MRLIDATPFVWGEAIPSLAKVRNGVKYDHAQGLAQLRRAPL
jgi:hypothetical protein